jgi:hypothetical protein
LFLIGTLCGLLQAGQLFTSLHAAPSRGQAVFAVTGVVLGLGINLGFGITLLVSKSIKAFTASR